LRIIRRQCRRKDALVIAGWSITQRISLRWDP
jgi:hypothetical protein